MVAAGKSLIEPFNQSPLKPLVLFPQAFNLCNTLILLLEGEDLFGVCCLLEERMMRGAGLRLQDSLA